ncbi:MAG: hypothetical protein NT171_16360 [Planctomycetota bacterium]|nr:hypothetical protein [Planctomycetota bacterium]
MAAAAHSDPTAAFRARAAGLEAAGLSVAWAGPAATAGLAEAVRLGADADRILEAAVRTGQDAAMRARGAWRPWFYPALVCAGAALGAALLGTGLTPLFEGVYAEFRVRPGSGLGLIEAARAAAPWLLSAMLAALAVAWWAATARRSRSDGADPLRAALGCETLAALADAGVLPEETAAVAGAFGIGSAPSTPPLIPWATGLDLGGMPRGEALRQAARVARARAARRDGEARQFGRIVVAMVIAGLAVLAYALVIFLPAIDFFMAISEASASR